MPLKKLKFCQWARWLLSATLVASLSGCLLPPDRPGAGTPTLGYEGDLPLGETAIVAKAEPGDDFVAAMLTGIEAVDGRSVIGTGLDFNVRPAWVRVPMGVHTVRIERRYPDGRQVLVIEADATFELKARHVYVSHFILHEHSVTEYIRDLGADPNFAVEAGNRGINRRRFPVDFGPKPPQQTPQESVASPASSVVFSGYVSWDPCQPGRIFCTHETPEGKASREALARRDADADVQELDRAARAALASKASTRRATASTAATLAQQAPSVSLSSKLTNSGPLGSDGESDAARIAGSDFSRLTQALQHFDARTPSGRTLNISLSNGVATVIHSGHQASGTYSFDTTSSKLCLSNMRPEGYAQMDGCYAAIRVDSTIVRLQSLTGAYHLSMDWPP